MTVITHAHSNKKQIIDLNEGAVATDHCKISVTDINKVNKATALNVPPNNFRILAPYVTAPPTLITLRKETCTCVQRSTTIFDTAGEEVILVKREIVKRLLFFQMQTSIFGLLFSSGAVSAGLESLMRLAEFIVDIYQQFPHS